MPIALLRGASSLVTNWQTPMGGDLFKLGRLERDDYVALEADLRVYLDERLGDHYRIPRYYGDKPDFGDVDIVVSQKAIETSWTDFMQQTMADLAVTDHHHTAGVFSTVWRDFQVDYFLRPEQYFLSTYNFLCYNDLGNLLGRIYRRMNLKYGERGLEYVFRRQHDGSYKSILPVSLDMERMLGLIGLDSAPWDAGFDSLDDMYRWVVGSPWFTPVPYLDPTSQLNKRTKSRPTMQKFLSWLHDNPVPDSTILLAHPDDVLELIDQSFPEAGLRDAITRERDLEERAKLVRTKFSGSRVMELYPELVGKRLGEFMRTFKGGFENFEAEIAEMEPEVVDAALHAHYASFISDVED